MSKFAIRVVLFAAVFLLGLGRGFADIPPGPPPRPRPRPQPIAPSQPAKYQVVAFWRLSNLSQSLATIGTYVPFPVPAQEGLKSLLGDFYGVVNQTAPVDVVLALDAATVPNLDAPPPVAVAFSVSSVAETRRIAKARGVLNGATTDRASISLPFAGESVPCALFGATGPGKIVCSTNDQYVSGLAPLLLQANVPGAQGKDLYGEVMVSTFESIFSAQWKQILDTGALTLPKKLSMGDPQFDRAMTDVIQAVIREMSAVSKDLSILAVDVSLKADQIQFSLGYKMVGTQSAWARSDAESAATKPSGPPAAFLALPKQVTSASFARSDPKWGRQLVAMVLPVLDAFLAKDGLPEADRQAIKDLLQKTSLKDGLSFDVMGVLQNPATAKPAKAPPNGLFSHDHFLSSSERLDGEKNATPAHIRKFCETWNRPGLQGYLRKKWKTLGVKIPLPVFRLENVAKPLGPQAAAMFFSLDLSWLKNNDKGKSALPSSLALYVVSTETGGRVWTATGANKAVLVSRLQTIGTLPQSETLASRADLGSIREPVWEAAGFMTLAGLVSSLDAALKEAEKKPGSPTANLPDLTNLLAVVPHHGEVPITSGTRAGSIGPRGLTKVASITIPKLVVEDMIALVMNLAANAKK